MSDEETTFSVVFPGSFDLQQFAEKTKKANEHIGFDVERLYTSEGFVDHWHLSQDNEWLKQLEQINRQIATLAHIKKLAEDEMARVHKISKEYHNQWFPGEIIDVVGSDVKPYGTKWWVTIKCNVSKKGSVIKQYTETVLVQYTPDGWAAEFCPVMA